LNLSGLWRFRPDFKKQGENEGWQNGLTSSRPIAVPASWNDQYSDLQNFFGIGWYETRFALSPAQVGLPKLHIGAAFYRCKAWLNGTFLGEHEGGFLPFEVYLGSLLAPQNLLVVQVDGQLTPDTVPSARANSLVGPLGLSQSQYPAVDFDYFPYAGLYRPVYVSVLPSHHLRDLDVTTEPLGADAVRVTVDVTRSDAEPLTLRASLCGEEQTLASRAQVERFNFELTAPKLWSPASPTLHDLLIDMFHGEEHLDQYTLPVGLRWLEVQGASLLLNDVPVSLQGFGKHEDFPLSGRGVHHAVNVRDYDLMRWCGSNSFRTAHYPYADEMLDLADQLGFLVIAETPAVSLRFGAGWEKRLELCRQQTRALIDRDKNRASVVMWSLANEPHTWSTSDEKGSEREVAQSFLGCLVAEAKDQDPTRPVTLVSMVGVNDEAFAFCDVVCCNRYYGWYTECGQIEAGVAKLEEELHAIYERYKKPIILSEFGADAVHGVHAEPPEMFSEEYQAELIRRTLEATDRLPFVIGQHIWAFADFRTSQSITRVGGLNHKGIFTRDRQPKLAAHVVRRLWND